MSSPYISPSALAQDNYEIQVYGAETLEPGSTMIELHSNFTMPEEFAFDKSRGDRATIHFY